MKNLIILLLILLAVANLFAQDKEPVQQKFYFPAYSESDSVYLSDTLDFFKQDKFMLGWHWGGSKKISRSLNMNQKDISSKDFFEYEDIDSSVYLIVKSVRDYDPDYKMFYTHCDNKAQLIHAKAIQYEPTFRKWESENWN